MIEIITGLFCFVLSGKNFVRASDYDCSKLSKGEDMEHINTVLREIYDQLGVSPYFKITVKAGGAEVSLRWQDEGRNTFQLEQFVGQEDLPEKSLTEILALLCDDIRDLLQLIKNEKSEHFYRELMAGSIPTDLPGI